jgi:hypothetical protein
VPKRFDVPFSTRGKRAVREKWQRSVPPNGNTNWNKTAVFPEIGNKIGNSEALFPSNNTLAAKNGSAWKDPAAKSGSKNGSNTELAAKNGSAGNDPAAKSGSKNGSNTELAAKNGSAGNDPAAKSGSKNGSNIDSAAKNGSAGNDLLPKVAARMAATSTSPPTSMNGTDSLPRFYLKQFHWAVHHPFQPTKGEDKEQGKRPWCKA